MDRRRRGVSELRETPLLRKDGSSLFVLIEASPLLDEQGRYTGGVGMVTDISMRKRTEEQLALLAAVVESSSDAVIACSLDGAVQSWNPAAERLFGHSAADMRGKALSTILPSGEESLLALIDVAARGEFAGPVEIETVAKDGMCIPVDLTAFPVETARGDVGGIAVTMRDVRERHEAERRIRENQRVLGDIEKAGRVGTWEWHIDRGERAWSAEVYRIHGVQPGEFVPTRETLLAAVHSEDRERVRKAVDRAAETFKPLEVRYRLLRPSGEVRHVQVRAEPNEPSEAGDRRMTGTFQDLTQLVVAEETARAARAELRRRALHDPLTSLPNRMLFLDRLTVALNGDGGDESFGGYTRYVANRYAARLDGIPAWLRQSAGAAAVQLRDRHDHQERGRRAGQGPDHQALLPAGRLHRAARRLQPTARPRAGGARQRHARRGHRAAGPRVQRGGHVGQAGRDAEASGADADADQRDP